MFQVGMPALLIDLFVVSREKCYRELSLHRQNLIEKRRLSVRRPWGFHLSFPTLCFQRTMFAVYRVGEGFRSEMHTFDGNDRTILYDTACRIPMKLY